MLVSNARIPAPPPGFRVFFLFFGLLAASLAPAGPAILEVPSTNVLDAVHAQYAAVSNVSCTVRRDATAGTGGKIEVMSRIVWARGDLMNVQTVKPAARRVVIDGKTVQVKGPGDNAPAIYQTTNQTPTQVANLRSVPGSPEELLAPLAGLAAADRPAVKPFARSVAFTDADSREPIAILHIDSAGRVAKLEYTGGKEPSDPPSSTTFHGAFEALPGVWLFRRVETEARIDGRTLRLVSRFDKFAVNGDLPASIFDPKAFF